MSLTCTQVGSYSDTTGGGGPFPTGSFSFTANKWYVFAYLMAASAASNLRTAVVSGATSGTLTAKGTLSFATIAANTMRGNYHYFKAPSTYSEALTITVTGANVSSHCAVLVELNSDPAGSFWVQGNSGRGDAGTTATPTALTSFADATNNGTLLVVGKSGTGAISAGSGMTLVGSQSITVPDCRIAILFRIGEDTAPTATFSSADWYASAAEITKDASTGSWGPSLSDQLNRLVLA